MKFFRNESRTNLSKDIIRKNLVLGIPVFLFIVFVLFLVYWLVFRDVVVAKKCTSSYRDLKENCQVYSLNYKDYNEGYSSGDYSSIIDQRNNQMACLNFSDQGYETNYIDHAICIRESVSVSSGGKRELNCKKFQCSRYNVGDFHVRDLTCESLDSVSLGEYIDICKERNYID